MATNNRIINTLTLLHLFAFGYGMCTLLGLAFRSGREEPAFFIKNLLLLIPILALYLLVQKVSHIIPYLILAVIVCLLPSVVIGGEIGITHSVYLFILASFNIRDKGHPHELSITFPSIPYLVVYALAFIANQAITHYESMFTVLIVCMLLSINAYLLLHYELKLEGLFDINEDHLLLPRGQIRRTSILMIGGFLLLATLIILLIPLRGLEQLQIWLSNGAMWLIAAILNGIRTILPTTSQEITSDPIILETSDALEFTPGNEQSAELPYALNVIAFVIMAVITIAVVICLICFLGYLLYQFLKSYMQMLPAAQASEEYEEISETIGSYETPDLFSRLRRKRSKNTTDIVRRLYKNVINKHRPKKMHELPSHLSPRELEEYVNLPDNGDVAMLHKGYEQARYSKDGVDAATYEAVKSAARNIR